MRPFLPLLFLLLMTACGQKGPLYLAPPKGKPVTPAPVSASQPEQDDNTHNAAAPADTGTTTTGQGS